MSDHNSRLIGLDFLRFAATSIVIVSHAHIVHGFDAVVSGVAGLSGLLLQFFTCGAVGVNIFFVLSGFLVSGLLFSETRRTGTVFLSRFLIRRGFKIYPAFWVMLAVTVGWMLYVGKPVFAGALSAELLYVQNYNHFICFHTWTLALEEHFYFLLAAIFYFLVRRVSPGTPLNFKTLPGICVGVALFCLFFRIFMSLAYSYHPGSAQWLFHSDFCVIDALFAGLLLSYFWHVRWDAAMKNLIISFRWPLLFLGSLVLIGGSVCYQYQNWSQIYGSLILFFGSAFLLLSSLSWEHHNSPRIVRGLAWLGKHSYSVYLWHIFVGTVVYPLIEPKLPAGWTWVNLLVYFSFCWLAGILLAYAVEVPVLMIRDRWFPTRSMGRIVPASASSLLADPLSAKTI